MKKFKTVYTFIYLYILLIFFDIELYRNGFSNTFRKYTLKYSEIKEWVNDERILKKIIGEINQEFSTLDVVCAWYPRKADCIHKTLLGYRIIRKKYKLPVDMVVGIRKFPFEAHAWLKIFNYNFFDEDEKISRYKIILRSNNLIEGD